jgi:hypothetical protein
MADVANGEAVVEKTRASKTQRLFYNKDGVESNRVGLDSVAWKLIYVPTGDHWSGKLDDLADEVRNAAALFGLITNITNAIGSSKLTDAECIESVEGRLEALTEGRWTMERETGPRTSDLVAAMRALAAEQGREFTEEQATALGNKFADEANGPAERKKYMGNPQFKAHFDAIKLQRAQDRLKKSQEAAKSATKTDADELFNV